MAATLYVTEFNAIGGIGNFPTSAAQQTPVAEQIVLITGSSVQSSTFNANTTLIRLHNDGTGACSIEFGANPTATAAKARMAANQTEYFSVPRNSGFKVAVITNT